MENYSVLTFYMNTLLTDIPINVALREVSEGRVGPQKHQSETDFIYLAKTPWSRLGTEWNRHLVYR